MVQAVVGDVREMGFFPGFTTNCVWWGGSCSYSLSF